MALFDPAAHEPLTQAAWDEPRVRAAVERIADETVAAHQQERGTRHDHSLWTGAAGTLWALDRLGHGIG